MSLNNKRRIFRRDLGTSPTPGRRLPLRGVLLAALGGATLLAAGAFFVHSSNAPAQAPPFQQVSALADELMVINGDTLRVGDHVVGLEGIAAPARGTRCHSALAGDVDCGAAAANRLAALVRDGPTHCVVHGDGQAGRAVAACESAGVRLNEALVRGGWARAQSPDLQQAEADARADRTGIWRTVNGS